MNRLLVLALVLAAPAVLADEPPTTDGTAVDAPSGGPHRPTETPAAAEPDAPASATAPASTPEPAKNTPPPDVFAPYDSAETLRAGRLQFGVFAPLRWGITNDVELEIHPLVSLVAPSPLFRITHLRTGGWTVTGEYGLSYPSFLFGQSRGYFFPTGENAGQVGQHLVPRVGVSASGALGVNSHATVRGDVAFGIPLVAGNLRSMDSFLAPLELLMAPVFRGFRAHVGLGYDQLLTDFLRLRATLDGFFVGAQPAGYAQSSPLFISAHVGLDVKVGERSRFTLGAIWWNWDNFRTEMQSQSDGTVDRVRVRSNDFLPTIDFILGF